MNAYTSPPRKSAVEELILSRHISNPISRALFASFAGADHRRHGGKDQFDILKALWPTDRDTAILLRAPTSPLEIGDMPHLEDAGKVAAFFTGLTGSAAARLFEAGLFVDLSGYNSASLPFRGNEPVTAPWVGEGDPIPVRSGLIESVMVGPPRKASFIMAFSKETARRGNAEAVFRTLMLEEAALTVDAAIFNDDPATDANPAGLLYGVTPLEAFPGGDELAFKEDMKALTGAIATGGGTGALALIVNPARFYRMQLLAPTLPWSVWPSRAVDDGTIIAVDPAAFAYGSTGVADIDATEEAVLHMSDDPLPIRDSGVTADPVRSLYQANVIALRLTVWMSFAMRGTGLVQVIEGATW